MRFLSILLLLIASVADAQQLLVVKIRDNQHVAFSVDDAGNYRFLGTYTSVRGIGETPTPPPPPPTPVDEPTGPGQLICVRPWSCTLDESDADLTIRESLDAVQSKVAYIRLLPGTPDQRMQLHQAERYRSLVKDATKAWVFHVVPTRTTPRILHQGPIDADAALGWVGVKRIQFAAGERANEAPWLNVDFAWHPQALTGALELPPDLQREMVAAATNVRTLPGFQPIPKSEWPAWVARFPVERLAKSIRNISQQTCSSCVGHACANEIEAGEYMMGGDLFFRKISGMSMYKRIGRSSGSGAYIPDAADEIFARGIIPVTGEPYPHTFSQDSGWSTPLPAGWEETGKLWKAIVYHTDDEEAGFRVGMDCRLGRQIGRSSHSLNAGGYTGKSWWYENSWGTDWGDLGKGIGYDSRFYSGFVYQPVLRDEIPVLLARELPPQERRESDALEDAAQKFHDKMESIRKRLKP